MNQQPQINPNYESIGREFVRVYYEMYDAVGRKPELLSFYQESALLTFEGDQKVGREEIVKRHMAIQGLTKHTITTLDSQPTADGGVFIVVMGKILTEGETNPLGFIHTFILRPMEGSFFISNEVFRLAVHDQ